MAVNAEQFPVAAVGRVVVMVVILVVDSKLCQFFAGKLPAAACADLTERPGRPAAE